MAYFVVLLHAHLDPANHSSLNLQGYWQTICFKSMDDNCVKRLLYPLAENATIDWKDTEVTKVSWRGVLRRIPIKYLWNFIRYSMTPEAIIAKTGKAFY